VLTKKLKALNLWLEQQVPDLQSRYYVDTGPIQEKAWAERAGLGWVGKNGNLISRDYGSWLFLGEIVTNITLQGDRPHSQHCGTCTRCLESCPTQAIVEPFVVDSNKCIAYHTIENRAETLPTAIADNLQGWVAGCDICQDVCPWNQRFAQPTDVADFDPYEGNLNPELETLANITEADWQQQFTASALRRIKPAMLRRNAQANLQ
jgi:epoxyqueuosine reductase